MATIYYLIRCNVCNKRIKENESYTKWENAHYCEPCFDDYMDLIEPSDFLDARQNSDEKDY